MGREAEGRFSIPFRLPTSILTCRCNSTLPIALCTDWQQRLNFLWLLNLKHVKLATAQVPIAHPLKYVSELNFLCQWVCKAFVFWRKKISFKDCRVL